MITINGKEYRNLQEQVEKNKNDIEELKTGGTEIDAYTKAESDAKFQTIAGMGSYATEHELELSIDTLATGVTQALGTKQDTLVSGTNIKTINGNSILGLGNIQIGEGGTTITGGNGIDVSTDGTISVDTDVVVTKDDHNNVNGILQVEHLESEDWDEDDDNKSHIYLNSGLRKSTIVLETEGEESGSTITLSGTTSVGSNGTVLINSGNTTFVTHGSRIFQKDAATDTYVNEVAYLDDLNERETRKYEFAINIGTLSRRFIRTFYADQGAYPTGTVSDSLTALTYLSTGDVFYNTDDKCLYTFDGAGQTLFIRKYDGTMYNINGQYPPVPALTITITQLD